MALADLIRGKPGRIATATGATAATDMPRPREPIRAPVAAVAGVAVATPPGVLSASWVLHFAEGESIEMTAYPPLGHAQVLVKYPTALAAEPLSAPMPREMPHALTATFMRCVETGLYAAEELPVLRAMYAADAPGTRALVEAMHARIGRCNGCRHFARPELSDGYCGGRADLVPAYRPRHPLQALPADGGANCAVWVER